LLKFTCKSSETDNVWKGHKKHLREKIFKKVFLAGIQVCLICKVWIFKSDYIQNPFHYTDTTTATLYCLNSTLPVHLIINSYILAAGGFLINAAVDALQTSFQDLILR
jgi:hypothetical protein